MKQLSARVRDQLLRMQQNEINEYHVYQKIAATVKQPGDRETLLRIADAELAHAKKWESYTGAWPSPQKGKIFLYSILSRIFGYTFTLKLMENGENAADSSYQSIADEVPEAAQIAAEEQEHEQELLAILDEDRLQYVGSMVLGLNDALVELTGTLAGLSFALQNNRLIALSGLITGVSATFSMASSAYLSAKSEGDANAFQSSAYTGVMYLITVALLILPYLLFPVGSFLPALGAMLLIVVSIIFVFTYYISVAKDLPFKQRFLEMFFISISVMALSFVIGLLVKRFLGIDV